LVLDTNFVRTNAHFRHQRKVCYQVVSWSRFSDEQSFQICSSSGSYYQPDVIDAPGPGGLAMTLTISRRYGRSRHPRTSQDDLGSLSYLGHSYRPPTNQLQRCLPTLPLGLKINTYIVFYNNKRNLPISNLIEYKNY
jgi:hypothetical protein